MSIFNEYDYIDLENRGRAEIAARQWLHVTQASRKAMRNAHMAFICKIYIIAVSLVAIAAIQWLALITSLRLDAEFLNVYNLAIPALIFLNFLMMVLILVVLRGERLKSKLTIIVYIFVTVEVSSATLARPLTQSMTWHLLKATVSTLTVVGISLILALVYHLEVEHDHLYLTKWSIRFFLMTSTCLLLTLSFDNMHVVTSITFLMLFFITIFVITWGRSLGSLEFYREESSYLYFYITLAYLNFLSLLINSLVFFESIDLLQTVELS